MARPIDFARRPLKPLGRLTVSHHLSPCRLTGLVLKPLRSRVATRGFTLVELLVVVIIIAIFAVVAIPSTINRLRDRRVRQAGEEVATLYRNARLQAMGRGSAVLVRFTRSDTNPGTFQVKEAVWGATTPSGATSQANCARLPSSSCSTNTANQTQNWEDGAADNQLIDALRLSGVGQDLRATMLPPSGGALSFLDVCFTPVGRTFFRTVAGDPFVPFVGVHRVDVGRYPGGSTDPVGVLRKVALLPNGAARIVE